MAVFADQLDLRTEVLELVGRTDVVDVFQRQLRMAETRLNRKIRVRDQIRRTDITFVDRSAAIPDGFLEVLELFNASKCAMVQQPVQKLLQDFESRGFYAVSNGTFSAPDGVYDLVYYTEIPTIADSLTATNWLLEKFPDVYLYAAGAEMAKYLKDVEMTNAMNSFLEQAMDDLMTDDFNRQYSQGAMRVGGYTP